MDIEEAEKYLLMLRRNKVHTFKLRIGGDEIEGEMLPDAPVPPKKRNPRLGADGLSAEGQLAAYGQVLDGGLDDAD